MPLDLLRDELLKRDYLLNKIPKQDSWTSATFIVPFKV